MTTTAATTRTISGLGQTPALPCAPKKLLQNGGAGVSPAGRRDACPTKTKGFATASKRAFDPTVDCVHCGLCLPACPTYTQNGLEADSPRGRLYLMKGLETGRIDATATVRQHLDLCLDCRACETACPSGVIYHDFLQNARQCLAPTQTKTIMDSLVETISFHIFPYPAHLQLALLGPRVLQKIGLWGLVNRIPLPAPLARMRQLLPAGGPLWERPLGEHYPARAASGKTRVIGGFFAGCVGSVLYQNVNRQAIELLQLAGSAVIVPRGQTCCGAIHHHASRTAAAQHLARANIDAFLGCADLTYITAAIAGCGAMLREYDRLLRDDAAFHPRAQQFVSRVRDISEVLVELGLPVPSRRLDLTVTYHDACHLAHAQKVTDAPRQLLQSIPGLKLVLLSESEVCCGAAGTYNIVQPGMARELAERKVRNIQATGAAICVTGNVGCAMQIQSEAVRLGVQLEVVHPVTLLHRAYCQ